MPRQAPQVVSVEDFIKVYQSAPDTAAVAAHFGKTRRWAINRAAGLRRHGVPMKRMPNARGSRSKKQIQALVTLATKSLSKP